MRSRHQLTRRLTYLWTLELLGAGLFCYLVVVGWRPAKLGPLTGIGLGLVVFLLTQGSTYWYAKLRALHRRPLLSDRVFVRLFRASRAVSLVGLGAGGVALLAVAASGSASGDLWAGLGLWGLATLEYVNYYRRQLLYDTPAELRSLLRAGRLKVARLCRDLDAGRL